MEKCDYKINEFEMENMRVGGPVSNKITGHLHREQRQDANRKKVTSTTINSRTSMWLFDGGKRA